MNISTNLTIEYLEMAIDAMAMEDQESASLFAQRALELMLSKLWESPISVVPVTTTPSNWKDTQSLLN